MDATRAVNVESPELRQKISPQVSTLEDFKADILAGADNMKKRESLARIISRTAKEIKFRQKG